jgi:hypothetical protein
MTPEDEARYKRIRAQQEARKAEVRKAAGYSDDEEDDPVRLAIAQDAWWLRPRGGDR